MAVASEAGVVALAKLRRLTRRRKLKQETRAS
jgi:hypothetical protein